MFISIEGVDGAGKTTFAHALSAALRKRGLSVVHTTEPGGIEEEVSGFSHKIRDLFRSQKEILPTMSEILLLLSARVYNLNRVVRPALASQKWVITDRFNDSMYAYQGYGSECSLEVLDRLIADAECDLVPNITFFIDIVPEMSLKRIPVLDAIENRSSEFHKRVYLGYLALAQKFCSRIVRLNGKEKISDLVVKALHVLQVRGLL